MSSVRKQLFDRKTFRCPIHGMPIDVNFFQEEDTEFGECQSKSSCCQAEWPCPLFEAFPLTDRS